MKNRCVLHMLRFLPLFFLAWNLWAGPPISSGLAPHGGSPEQALAESIEDPEYGRCGQDCLYTKAKEILSLQTYYVIRKRSFLMHPLAGSPDEKRALLGAFCQQEETLTHCLERYLQFSEFFVLKQRTGLGQNQKILADLKAAPHTPTIQTVRAPHRPVSQPMVPSYAKAGQLASFAKTQKDEQAPPSAQEWAKQLRDQLKPNPEDFVSFEEKQVLSSHTGSREWIEVPQFQDGKPILDQAAYDKALKAWEKWGKNLEGSTTQNPESWKKKQEFFQNQFIKQFEEAKPTQKTSERVLYEQVRGTFIQGINQTDPPPASQNPQTEVNPLNGWGKSSLDFPQNHPAKQEKKFEQVKIRPPEGGYTGEEEVLRPASGESKTSRSIHIQAGQIAVTPPPPRQTPSSAQDEALIRLRFDTD